MAADIATQGPFLRWAFTSAAPGLPAGSDFAFGCPGITGALARRTPDGDDASAL
ncbi:hypothetical protein [Streptomyces nojiriensis]|uniref:hypothetical protein n=1 Tax=Streptomyces nojiriensis TaxID=66374 RepID=UPI003653C0A3